MYELERRGVQCALVDRQDIDLWVRTPSGRLLTVQVKASLPRVHTNETQPRYRFDINRSAAPDLYALVALDREVVVLCYRDAAPNRILADEMTDAAMEASIRELLA